MFSVSVLLLALCLCAFQAHALRVGSSSGWTKQSLARGIAVGVLLPFLSISPVFADDVTGVAAPTPMSVRVIGTSTPTSDSKKIERASTSAETDDTYMTSLKKEAAKQNAMKKTKAQKAVDLCERLGRGC
jgi:hypothetical protein